MLAWAIPRMFEENSVLSFVLSAVFTKGFLDNIELIIDTSVFLLLLIVLCKKINEVIELA